MENYKHINHSDEISYEHLYESYFIIVTYSTAWHVQPVTFKELELGVDDDCEIKFNGNTQ